jgi:hypothetical protein
VSLASFVAITLVGLTVTRSFSASRPARNRSARLLRASSSRTCSARPIPTVARQRASSRATLAQGRANAERMFAGEPKLLADVLVRRSARSRATIGDHVAADATLQRSPRLYLQEGMTRQAAQAHADLAFNAIKLGDLGRAERAATEAGPPRGALPDDDLLHGNILYVRAHGSSQQCGASIGRRTI